MTALNQHIGTPEQPFYRATGWKIRWLIAGDYSAVALRFVVGPSGAVGADSALIDIPSSDPKMSRNHSAGTTTVDLTLVASDTALAPKKYAYALVDTATNDVLAEGDVNVSWAANTLA